MKNLATAIMGFWFTYVVGVWICWGLYGSRFGMATKALSGNNWMAAIGVGVAYLLVAWLLVRFVALPILRKQGIDDGEYTPKGKLIGRIAGLFVASGAVTLSYALKFCPSGHGQVMPLVFCGVPLVSILYALATKPPKKEGWSNSYKALFGLGVVFLLLFGWQMIGLKEIAADSHHSENDSNQLWMLATGWTVLSWGLYVALIHSGSMAMKGKDKLCKSLRALTHVGEGYFAVAVIALGTYVFFFSGEPLGEQLSTDGALKSIIAGFFGVGGNLCIILAINRLGPTGPLTVPPLVFSGTPAVNTIVFLMPIFAANQWSAPEDFPLQQLVVTILVGAIGVALVTRFKPKPPKPSSPKTEPGN
ncbi:MAG: hypothetical protein AAFN77_24160 [Planctomycetota bacterium]